MVQWALEQIQIPDSGKVADLGCGGGYNIRRMLGMSEKAKFIGIDISDESVKKAQKINKDEIGKRVNRCISWKRKRKNRHDKQRIQRPTL